MNAAPFNWKRPAGRALEAALNRALALDPDAQASLRALDGHRVALRVESPALALEVRVDGDALRVGPVDGEREPDLGVRGTLAGLLGQLPMFRRDDAPPVGKLRIEGDAELARRLQALARNFDPDWHKPFADVFGDVIGVQVANGFAVALKQARDFATNGAQTVAEYVTEESRDVVPKAELDAFHDDVERLAARIARLPRAGGRA
jgi:ubiquinone biosynthesis protein UbiJ